MGLTLKQQLQNDLKDAMRDHNERRKLVVRLIVASVRNAEVDARTDGRGGVLSDADVMALIRREIKQHEESLAEASNAARVDLVTEQNAELDILRSYLPKQLTREQITELARQVIADVKATTPKQQGEVMKALLPKIKDTADGKLVSVVVRELLK